MEKICLKIQINRTFVIAFIIVLMGVSIIFPKRASAKSVSKKAMVITLTSKKEVKHKLSIKSSEKVVAKVDVLSVKGVVTEKESDLCFGYIDFACYKKGKMIDGGEGSFFANYTKPKLKKSSFKKGKVLRTKGNDCYITGKAVVEWVLPKGISKMKIRVTYYTKSGKVGIKSVK